MKLSTVTKVSLVLTIGERDNLQKAREIITSIDQTNKAALKDENLTRLCTSARDAINALLHYEKEIAN